MIHRTHTIWVIALLLFLRMVPIDATSAMRGFTGILEGRVVDKNSRKPLVGVNIVVMGTSMGAATDVDGLYYINNIRAGVYDVRFSMIGYKTLIMQKVTILPDLRTRQDIELEESPVQLAPIEIIAEKPLIQRDQAATSFSFGEVKLEKLPISRFQDVLGLQPGTTLEGNVRGGKTNEVIFYIDGLPVQDVIGGGLGVSVPRSSITGLTIFTGGFEAEYGNALSGLVNVVTKSGSDRHKFALRLERDNWAPDSWSTQHDRALELELTAGGPLRRGDLYYFTATTLSMSDTRWWQDFQHYFSSPVSWEVSGFAKAEYTPSPSLRFSAQGIYSLRKWHDYEFSWRYNLAGLPVRSRDAYRAALMLTHTLTSSSFYTVSLSRFFLQSRIGEGAKEDLVLEPFQYDFYLRYVLGGQRNWWALTKQTVYTLKADFTAALEKSHLIKIGVEFNQFDIFSDLVKYDPQRTYFGKPLLGVPLLNFSNSYNYFPRSGSVYVQDKIEFVRDGSNMSMGLRWDFLDPTAERPIVEFIPVRPNEFQQKVVSSTPATFKHQVSPRLSFAAPISTTSFIFMNFGHYFQFPLFDYLYSGTSPSQLFSGARNVLTGNPDLEPERTIAWELGLKYVIDDSHLASLTYFRKSFRNQIDSKTLIPFDSKSAGDFGFASYVNNAEASATGLEFVLTRERKQHLTGTLSYTYMITEGVSEYVDQTINYAQWGFPLAVKPFPLSWDQRHTIKLDAEIQPGAGLLANLVVLYNSPRPYTFFPTRDGFSPLLSTKLLLPNNARMRENVFVHLKVSRQFEFGTVNPTIVTLFVDGRNILNTQNVRWIDSNGRIGGELPDPSAYYDPRRVRIGLRVGF